MSTMTFTAPRSAASATRRAARRPADQPADQLAEVVRLRPEARAVTPTPVARRGSAQPVAQGRLRLTRRGRVVVVSGALALLMGLSWVFGASSVATRDAGQPVPTEIVLVGTGDTLWGIASEVAAQTGESDVRDVMARIERLNAIDGGLLHPGQKLRVPTTD